MQNNNSDKSVKINDIAKAAGVSPSTVSYVLSGKRPISDEVKQKVLEKIEALGYRPNAVARNLASKKTHTIGLYCSKNNADNDLFFLKMVNGIMGALANYGYKLLLINEIEDKEDFTLPLDKSYAIDGAIITNARNSQHYLADLSREKMPFVLIGKPPKDVHVNYVDNDNMRACYKAVESLIEQNARKIGLVIDNAEYTTVNIDYMAGYIMSHSDYQLPIDNNHIIRIDRNDPTYPDKVQEIVKTLHLEGLILNSLFIPFINKIWNLQKGMDSVKMVIAGFDILKEYCYPDNKELIYIESNAYKLGYDAGTFVAENINGKSDTIQKLYTAELRRILP